jgi:hypothetical protein
VPSLYQVVEPADVAAVVRAGPLPDGLVEAFVAAGRDLVAEGADFITTSCGFLVTAQDALQAALPVPVVTSSLLQVAAIEAELSPGARVGVITIDAGRLSPAHLAAAGAPADTPLAGLENGGELHRVITRDLAVLDQAAAESDVLAAGQALLAAHPDLGAVVLECTNLPPYRAALSRALGLPVYDLVTLVEARLAAL